MSVKSTVDLNLEQARALFRTMIPNDQQIEDELLEHIGGDGWLPDPAINREFLEMLRGKDEITNLETIHRSIEHVLEAAFDIVNHGEGNRNFFLVFGDLRGKCAPLDTDNLVDSEIMDMINEGMQETSARPGM